MSYHLNSTSFARRSSDTSPSPPPIKVRFFYTSPQAIDDPLSPIPPPTSTAKQAPRPFSDYDNAALDKAWLETRRKLLQHRDLPPVLEKSRPRQGTLESARGGGVSAQSLRKSLAEHQIGQPLSSPRHIKGHESKSESAASSYSKGSLPASLRATGETELTPSLVESSNLTGNPFIRAPARTEPSVVDQQYSPRRDSIRPAARATDSYNWGEDELVDPRAGSREESQTRPPNPSKPSENVIARIPVGVSRLHNVLFPNLQYVQLWGIWDFLADVV